MGLHKLGAADDDAHGELFAGGLLPLGRKVQGDGDVGVLHGHGGDKGLGQHRHGGLRRSNGGGGFGVLGLIVDGHVGFGVDAVGL